MSDSLAKTPRMPARTALTATKIVALLTQHEAWALDGDGNQVAICKTYRFANYYETIAFVNALAFIAHQRDHHPDLSVHYRHCVVRLRTHDAGGISQLDFDCAAQIDALRTGTPA